MNSHRLVSPARFAWFALLALLPFAARPAAAAEIDKGSFRVYQGQRPLGAELFTYEAMGDSIQISSATYQTIPTPAGDDTLQKSMALLVDAFDYGLRNYSSIQDFQKVRLMRGLVIDDTAFTSFREVNKRGEASRLVRPPGRVFVLDPQMFTLFDVICRNLYNKTFESRPVQVVMLGAQDSILEATATNMGTELLRWGAKSIQTRKISIGDSRTQFVAWMDPNGRMLKLEEPASGLRVERAPAEVKPAALRPRPRPRPKRAG